MMSRPTTGLVVAVLAVCALVNGVPESGPVLNEAISRAVTVVGTAPAAEAISRAFTVARPVIPAEAISRAVTVARPKVLQEAISRPITVSSCPADLDGSDDVGVPDLLLLLAQWGPCPPNCFADMNGDGAVNVPDLLQLLAAWGMCP